MTKEEIEEINEALIAEFMDLEYIPYSQSNGDNGWWKKGTFREGCSVGNSDFICVHTWRLNYNSDFNKLIQVVKKINDFEDFEFKLVGSRASIKTPDGKRFISHTISILNSTYNVVVEFIKWYNLQNKK